jgi:hypothetical protein
MLSLSSSRSEELAFDVLVAGAGIGGICAAIAAARIGCRVALLEAAAEIGGTGVHSPVGLVCTWFDATGRPINKGLYAEILLYLYAADSHPREDIHTYREEELKAAYLRLLRAETSLRVFTSCAVIETTSRQGSLTSVRTSDGREFFASVFVDSTADGNLAAAAGASFQKGREHDGKLQPGTLTFRVEGVDFRAFGLDPSKPHWARWDNFHVFSEALLPLYRKVKDAGLTSNPKSSVLCFPDREGSSLLFNQTHITGLDPTDPASMRRALEEGRKQISEFWEAIREHPAFANVRKVTIFEKMGVREGRRILGDYLLTAGDCLGEARFEDMVAACGYAVDIHDPSGSGDARLEWIPGSGYYHIPYRCLYSRDFTNLMLGSRCISGTHEAHSSYRVMPPISSIGQAVGTAAALMSKLNITDVRRIESSWIRHELEKTGQFVEGRCEPAPLRNAAAGRGDVR